MRRLTIIIVVIICSVAIIKVVAETIADNERPPHHGISHISGPTYSSSSENGNSTYSGGYSSRSTNSYDTYQNAEEYAEDNVEEYKSIINGDDDFAFRNEESYEDAQGEVERGVEVVAVAQQGTILVHKGREGGEATAEPRGEQ